MPTKTYVLPDVGDVHITKRSTARTIKLRITGKGLVAVSIPTWMPYSAGLLFAKSKTDWILASKPQARAISDGQTIAHGYTVRFTATDASRPRSAVRNGIIYIYVPDGLDAQSPEVQRCAETACVKILRIEATRVLPPLLARLASAHGFQYRSVTIKRLHGRWGSCDSAQNIVLNSFLMQLPQHLIEYVLIHELVHTKIMAHGAPFWAEVGVYVPRLAHIRKLMRSYQPEL